MSFAPGENVGAYRIVKQLGSGGMATVFQAYHAALDRDVAIKVLHPVFKGDANFLSRFQREARVVAKLEHPNIVPVYDFSEHEGSPYLVLRFIEGETLKARLDRGQLTLPEILDVIRPMGEALTYAHTQGVLHRDVKPSNVMLTQDGKVFLTDFGLARIVQAGESSLTRDALVGTPYYISPEQAMGKSELDPRTDIYSFGVVLYELFTGRVPFQADTPFAVIHDHIYTPLPMPTAINPDLPRALERVLLKALAKEPDARYATAIELVTTVEEAVTGFAAVPTARPTIPPVAAPTDAVTVTSPQAKEPTKGPVPELADAAPTDVATVISRQAEEPTERFVPELADVAPPGPALRQRGRRLWLPILGALALVTVIAVAALLLLGGGDDEQTTSAAARESVIHQTPVDQLPVEELPSPEDVAILAENAIRMAAEGDLDGALGAFDEAIRQDPNAVPIYMEMARVLFERGEFEPAIEVLRRGVRANPDDVDLHLTLAQALVSAERWDEALHDIEWLIDHVPGLAEPHAYLSVHLAVNVGDADGAEREAAAALNLNPESAEAHFAMGVFYWKTGRPLRARAELERARESPNAPPFLRQRIQFILERLDQPDAEGP